MISWLFSIFIYHTICVFLFGNLHIHFTHKRFWVFHQLLKCQQFILFIFTKHSIKYMILLMIKLSLYGCFRQVNTPYYLSGICVCDIHIHDIRHYFLTCVPNSAEIYKKEKRRDYCLLSHLRLWTAHHTIIYNSPKPLSIYILPFEDSI